MPDLVYAPIQALSDNEVRAAVERNVAAELLIAVLSVALHSRDRQFAQDVCVKLATHGHFNVRGNALLGLGNIARIDGRLDEMIVAPLITAGLQDRHEYVRGQAESAKDDIEEFLGWTF